MKIIITGAPGTGKTTLLNSLKSKGFDYIGEPAREILYEQRKVGGKGVSEVNNRLFRDLILSRSINKFLTFNTKKLTFFDRGIPDVIAYSVLFDLDINTDLKASQEYRYNNKVFITSPWKNIYCNDKERKMSFEDILPFHDTLKKYYIKLGYELIEVPQLDVEMRADFVLNKLNINKEKQ